MPCMAQFCSVEQGDHRGDIDSSDRSKIGTFLCTWISQTSPGLKQVLKHNERSTTGQVKQIAMLIQTDYTSLSCCSCSEKHFPPGRLCARSSIVLTQLAKNHKASITIILGLLQLNRKQE